MTPLSISIEKREFDDDTDTPEETAKKTAKFRRQERQKIRSMEKEESDFEKEINAAARNHHDVIVDDEVKDTITKLHALNKLVTKRRVSEESAKKIAASNEF